MFLETNVFATLGRSLGLSWSSLGLSSAFLEPSWSLSGTLLVMPRVFESKSRGAWTGQRAPNIMSKASHETFEPFWSSHASLAESPAHSPAGHLCQGICQEINVAVPGNAVADSWEDRFRQGVCRGIGAWVPSETSTGVGRLLGASRGCLKLFRASLGLSLGELGLSLDYLCFFVFSWSSLTLSWDSLGLSSSFPAHPRAILRLFREA